MSSPIRSDYKPNVRQYPDRAPAGVRPQLARRSAVVHRLGDEWSHRGGHDRKLPVVMRIRHGRSTDERSAAALRRLAVIGADLSDDGRDDVRAEHPESAPGAGLPHPPPHGRHLGPSTPSPQPRLGGLHDRLPGFVHARLGGAGLTAQHVVVVVAVVVGFLALAVWWVVASKPSEVAPISTVESSAPPAGSSSTHLSESGKEPAEASVADTASGPVIVDVTGKVRRPGIVSLPSGSRVADAIDKAGGPLRTGIDLSSINLARVLVDGEQIVVGLPPVTTAAPDPGTSSTETPPATSSTPAPTTLVNLNTATLEQLDTLPGVGPVTGQAILDWRTDNGQFTTVEELIEIDGIGEVTLAELRDLVTV